MMKLQIITALREKYTLKKSASSGITLITLVITIIVLLILAGIGISAVVGDNSIIERTISAKDEERYSEIIEEKRVWEIEKQSDRLENGKITTASDIINKLYDDGKISLEEKETLLNGESIYIAGKEINFGGLEGQLVLSSKTRDGEDNIYSVISIFPSITGIPELKTYEEYINPSQYLEGKTDEEMAEYLVEYEKTQYSSYYANNYPGQEVTLELVLQDYGVTTLEELCENWGYETVEDLIIGGRYIGRTEYQQYYSYFQLQYAETITVTNPDGTTKSVSNLSTTGSAYTVFENGTYTFSAEYNGQIKSISVEITSIKNEELELAKDGDSYLIYTIEDLVRFSKNVNKGFNYEGKTVKLMNSLDFFQDNSYENPADTSFGDYNGDGAVEGIKEELIKITGKGFIPIAGIALSIPEANQTIEFSFYGTFEGNNYEINNLFINDNKIYNIGLFGKNYGTVQNLEVSGTITVPTTTNWSTYYVGSITGRNYGTIDNCTNNVEFSVDSRYMYIGGIAGYNDCAYIYNCKNMTDITIPETSIASGVYIGGIIGRNNSYSALIQNCFNYGEIVVTPINIINSVYVGGIFGLTTNSIRTLNCGNNADITVENVYWLEMGGISGHQIPGLTVNVYNKGDLTATNVECFEVGGLIGYLKNGRCSNAYNSGDILIVASGDTSDEFNIGGCFGENVTAHCHSLLNTGKVTVTGNSKTLVGGVGGISYYGDCHDVYNIGVLEVLDDYSVWGGIFGSCYWSSGYEPTGGYLEELAPAATGGGHKVSLTSMELDADILLEIFNAGAINESYISACDGVEFVSWKIDESVSTEYPVLEME